MDLTLYALAKVRSLYDAGASVEEVYETLREPSQTATERKDQAPASERRADRETVLTATAARDAYLTRLVEHPQQPPRAKAAPESPSPETAPKTSEPETSEPAADRTGPEPVSSAASSSAASSSAAPHASAPDEHPSTPVPDEATEDASPVRDLRDRIAVAVTQISMLKGSEERRKDGFGSSVREG